jgi:predicted helicase
LSFADLISEIRLKGNDGKDFEVFCKWFLLNDPYWKTQVDEVWLWDDWPQRWDRDKGVDLVFRHKNGEMWAVQSKCYAETTRITKEDVDSFLTDSNRKIISKRLLMASTNSLGRNAIETMAGQEKPVVRWMLDDFENSAIAYPQALSELNKSAETKEHEDRPYQLEAVEAVVEGLSSHDRGQLIMACGTGKTFVTLWIKERLKPQTCLVLLPSLSLLSQTLHEWTANCKDEFEVLCVCSDATVGKRNTDEDLRISEAPFDVTSDPDVIRTFLKQSRPKVIFCTYQSSELIGKAQGDAVIDLVVCDEAHRCAGPATASFTKVLDNKFIKAKKRLFTTATPRVFSKATVKSADARGHQIYGMDDETVFGPILHTYSFGQAIEDKWLTDYQVLIVGVDEPTIQSYIETREIVGSTEAGIVSDAETLAAKLSLLKATAEYDLKRVISFHGRVKVAKEFSSEYCDLIDLVEPSKRPDGVIWTDYVSGEMSAGDRKQKIQRLKKLLPNERGLLANSRCLFEGVDVPSLDGVAFIDPKGSQIDIIQAVGRALRKSDEKKFGTIILPVFIEPGDNEIERIENSNFKPVWDVLKALRSHDERLGESIDGIRTELGKRQKTKRTLPSNIIFDLPVNIGVEFSESLKTHLVEGASQSWHFWYGLLEAYVAETGNAWVPQGYEINGHRLGAWLGTQRRNFNKGLLSKDKIERLESLNGFFWDPIEEKWQIGLSYVKKTCQRTWAFTRKIPL